MNRKLGKMYSTLWPKKEMSDEEMDRVAEAIRAKAG
jgi:hypothetical protein